MDAIGLEDIVLKATKQLCVFGAALAQRDRVKVICDRVEGLNTERTSGRVVLSERRSSGKPAKQETQQLNLSLRAKSITYYITADFSPLQRERQTERE